MQAGILSYLEMQEVFAYAQTQKWYYIVYLFITFLPWLIVALEAASRLFTKGNHKIQ